jgi:hypothetical protein
MQFGLKVPQNASDIYNKSETFRDYIWTLDEIVFMYNNIQEQLNRVERPLVQSKIVDMDKFLEPGIVEHSWETNIKNFMNTSRKKVEHV